MNSGNVELRTDGPTDMKSLLGRLQEVQKDRAEEYNRLHASFQDLLHSHDAQAYRLKLDHATASFQGSSLKIRAIIDYLKSSQQHQELLELLQRLQFQEQAKMKFTLIVQALRSAESEGRFSWQEPLHHSASANGRTESDTTNHSCHTSVEPTEAEYNNALREATQELQKSVQEINDILEEAHFLQEDS